MRVSIFFSKHVAERMEILSHIATFIVLAFSAIAVVRCGSNAVGAVTKYHNRNFPSSFDGTGETLRPDFFGSPLLCVFLWLSLSIVGSLSWLAVGITAVRQAMGS